MNTTKKTALFTAAKELFGEYGYVETTFKKISERAGVALGLLTHHYGNKEKLFLAAGLDVLDHFLTRLRAASENATCGRDAVMAFCRAYLDFSIDPQSHWLVLVRCSPYSDMKTKTERDIMDSKFGQVAQLLESLIEQGMDDGSLAPCDSRSLAQVIIALMVGANRTRVLTPYAAPSLYEDTLQFVEAAIQPRQEA
ncbi:MAG: TetR/AcrR family transcriptional regulator [Desulfovibrio sp.]|nr:TetR/AcrR family transcriptional regulator [Desulfovibrio sp.]